MASAPSASALSAVLRCQRNILARKQTNKKPPRAEESFETHLRAFCGFILTKKRVESGVFSVCARLEKRSGITHATRNDGSRDQQHRQQQQQPRRSSTWTDDSVCNRRANRSNQVQTAKLQLGHCIFYFKTDFYNKSALVFRSDETRFLKSLRRFGLYAVCSESKSPRSKNTNSFVSRDLLGLVKKSVSYFTSLVSSTILGKLGNDWSQCDSSSDDMSGSCEHLKEDESSLQEGSKPGD